MSTVDPQFDYITDKSVVRANLDSNRRELIPWDGLLPAPIYMDVMQLRVCDLEFLVGVHWRTPYTDSDNEYRIIHAQVNIWKPEWYCNYTIASIMSKTYEVHKDIEPELGQRVLLQSGTRHYPR